MKTILRDARCQTYFNSLCGGDVFLWQNDWFMKIKGAGDCRNAICLGREFRKGDIYSFEENTSVSKIINTEITGDLA